MVFRGVQNRDIAETDQLFRACLTDLISREKIEEPNLLEEEVAKLNQVVQESLAAQECNFFVVEIKDRIAGTIALTKPNKLISEHIRIEPSVYEVACVYVHPNDQKQGIGKYMFQHIKQKLIQLGQVQYCLDAGFSSSQEYWKQQLGKPTIVIENLWGKGAHHLIWLKDL